MSNFTWAISNGPLTTRKSAIAFKKITNFPTLRTTRRNRHVLLLASRLELSHSVLWSSALLYKSWHGLQRNDRPAAQILYWRVCRRKFGAKSPIVSAHNVDLHGVIPAQSNCFSHHYPIFSRTVQCNSISRTEVKTSQKSTYRNF